MELLAGGRRRNRTRLAAAEALDANRFHTVVVGRPPAAVNARTGEPARPRQSVEYFGWTFSPRIFAIALFAAMAASPKPTVMSVILPS